IDWCHLFDRHRPTARDTTRKLVVPRAVCADQPNNTSFQHLRRIFVKSKGDLTRHQLLHTGIKAHKCTICSKTFAKKSNLTQHQAAHSDSRPFQCSKMPETEKLSETYDMYDEFDCEEGENEEVQVKEEEEDSETDFDAAESVDQSAGNEFQSAETMVKTEDQNEFQIDMFDDEFHFLMEQDFSAETNANRTNNAVNEEQETDSDATEIDEDDHLEVSESQQNTKPVVNCSSSSASGEQQLNGRRRRAKSHKCQQCDKSFDRPFILKQHQLVHTGIKAHKCTICSKSFRQKIHLNTHLLIHTDIRAHKCTICPKSFAQKGDLKKHQLVHNGIRAYQCPTCSKSFGQKENA
ncbi:hypothetical protein TYRP_006688, partial [Tyrophagus putrescentiae]